ncbi:MAG TPA: mobilization protein [Oculatellaceae cyanobacterium]|jgi:hypothetical protein
MKSDTKHFIHLVGGEKGGAGKTLFSRTLLQYCIDENFNFQAVEADFSNPDVADVYQGLCEKVQFSGDEKDAREIDRIFEWALEKVVIVNLPAQSHNFVKSWIDKNELIDLGEQNGIAFVHWFVCSGGYDSVQLFLKSIQEYDKRMPHILVKNIGLRDDWSAVDADKDFKKVTAKCKPYCTIEFPKLAYFERDVIDRERLRFDVAKQCKEFDFGVVNRQRINNFLRDAYAEINKTKLFVNENRIPVKNEATTKKPKNHKTSTVVSENLAGSATAVLTRPDVTEVSSTSSTSNNHQNMSGMNSDFSEEVIKPVTSSYELNNSSPQNLSSDDDEQAY